MSVDVGLTKLLRVQERWQFDTADVDEPRRVQRVAEFASAAALTVSTQEGALVVIPADQHAGSTLAQPGVLIADSGRLAEVAEDQCFVCTA